MQQPLYFLLAVVTIILVFQKPCSASNDRRWKYTLYVDVNTGNDSHACWSGVKTVPCRTLDYVASVVNDSTAIIILSSNGHSNSPQELVQVAEFHNLSDIQIYSDADSALVRCYNAAGLKFVNVTNLVVTNIQFLYCGSLQDSSSASYDNPKTAFKTASAIYLLNCTNVSLSSVECTLGSGTGVAMYDVGGTVIVDDCVFADNAVQDQLVHPGGSGLYIEHTACSVGNTDSNSCMHSYNPFAHHNHYLIKGCHFRNNHAETASANAVTFTDRLGPQVQRLGWGGGLMVSLMGSASWNTFVIDNCTFHGNYAPIGGAISLQMNQAASYNNITVSNSLVERNTACQGGGGAHFGYVFFNGGHVNNNTYNFYKVNFSHNSAVYGGGAAVYSTRWTIRSCLLTAAGLGILQMWELQWLYSPMTGH